MSIYYTLHLHSACSNRDKRGFSMPKSRLFLRQSFTYSTIESLHNREDCDYIVCTVQCTFKRLCLKIRALKSARTLILMQKNSDANDISFFIYNFESVFEIKVKM